MKQFGLVSRVFTDQASMNEAALKMATDIASKSPIAVQGTKLNLNYSRDHTVDESLNYMSIWNAAMLQTRDIPVAAEAFMRKTKAKFSKL